MDKLFSIQWSRWRYIALLFCGALLLANTWSLDHEPLRVLVSDSIAGILVVLFSICALSHDKPKKWIDWTIALIAAYLLIAPILLWATTSTTYLNDVILGAIIFALSVLFVHEDGGDNLNDSIPLGWDYNPSAFSQRLPVVTLAFFAYLFSRYMAFYQLGYITDIVDPVFGNGTHNVITSDISKAFPVSDAGLGSWVYAIEALMGLHGSRKRWHTIPWFVTLFAILVIPAGLVSVLLITLQPLIVGSYCFWCLITALSMLFMIAFAADEVVATILFLRSVRRRGGNVSKAFWHGDPNYETKSETLAPNSSRLFWGVTFPWNLILSALIGLGLMFYKNNYTPDHHIQTLEAVIGALVITFSVISFGEVIRSFRWVNIILGFIFAIFAIYSPETPGILYHVIIGVLLILLAIPKGKIRYSYGEWNKTIR